MKSRVASPVLVLACLGMLQPGCGGTAPTDKQEVTDTVNAYQSALVAGDAKTACSYVTPAFRKRFSGRGRNGSPPVSCARQVAYLHRDPGFLSVNKNLSVTTVTVHGTKAKVHSQSASKAVVSADYELVKKSGQWKIAQIFAMS